MKKIIYIGSQLQGKGLNPSSADTLANFLKDQYQVVILSHISNRFLRMVHILLGILFKGRDAKLILIDTYSTSAFEYAYYAGILAKTIGIRYVPIIHGGNIESRIEGDTKRALKYFDNAFKIVCPSYFTLNVLNRHNIQAELIPNSIQLKAYTFKSERSIDRIRLLYVRSIERIYNPFMAVHVVHKLKAAGHNVNLALVGPVKDDSLPELHKLISSLELEDNVDLKGRMSKQDWIDFSRGFNVFINTTNVDNTPVSVIEAMALGLPVVTTNVGGIPYLIENLEEGILVEPNDIDAMANAILHLINVGEERRKMVLKARLKVEKFDWEIIKHQWVELIERAS